MDKEILSRKNGKSFQDEVKIAEIVNKGALYSFVDTIFIVTIVGVILSLSFLEISSDVLLTVAIAAYVCNRIYRKDTNTLIVIGIIVGMSVSLGLNLPIFGFLF